MFPSSEFNFDGQLGDDCIALIRALLEHDPHDRAGGGVSDAQEVMSHPFYRDVDWIMLGARKVPPPAMAGMHVSLRRFVFVLVCMCVYVYSMCSTALGVPITQECQRCVLTTPLFLRSYFIRVAGMSSPFATPRTTPMSTPTRHRSLANIYDEDECATSAVGNKDEDGERTVINEVSDDALDASACEEEEDKQEAVGSVNNTADDQQRNGEHDNAETEENDTCGDGPLDSPLPVPRGVRTLSQASDASLGSRLSACMGKLF